MSITFQNKWVTIVASQIQHRFQTGSEQNNTWELETGQRTNKKQKQGVSSGKKHLYTLGIVQKGG